MDNNIKISKYQCSQNKKDYFIKMLSLLLYRKNKNKIQIIDLFNSNSTLTQVIRSKLQIF